jgi:hypothetical protein
MEPLNHVMDLGSMRETRQTTKVRPLEPILAQQVNNRGQHKEDMLADLDSCEIRA